MRWLPLLLIFLLAYIEISIFIKVAAVLGVAVTLLLVVFSSCVGISLVLAGFLLLIPGFFTDFLGLLLLLPPVQKSLTLKLMPHLSVYRPGGWTGGDAANGNTFDGEFQRKDDERPVLEHRPDEDRKPHDR